jgi:hypothetical protein
MAALAVTLVVLYLRHRNQQMLHQERMAALEKGTAIPLGPAPAPWSARVYLLRGLIWTFTGAALVICLFGISSVIVTQRNESAETMAWKAKNVSENLQIPLDQARQIVEKDDAARTNATPVPVALLGLIPLAVGLAYLVFHYTGDSRKLPAAARPEPPVSLS